MNKLVKSFKQFLNSEEGMGAVEYALIVALMATAIITSWPTLTAAFDGAFKGVAGHITSGK